MLMSEGGYGSEIRLGSMRIIAAGGGGGGAGADGGAGGTPGNVFSGIDGYASGFAGPPGEGGKSYGPPGTKFEIGVRSGDGLVVLTYEPETRIESGPKKLTNDSTPTFTFSTNQPAVTFACFDEFTFGACSGPHSHTTEALPDGRHKVAIAAVDSAGNADPTPATRTFTVDTIPPAIRVTEGPGKTVESSRKRVEVGVSFNSPERKTTFECRLDNGEYRRCDSPYSVEVKAKRRGGTKHRISIRGADRAGNKTPVSVDFTAIREG
jgi:hypothetical protein